MKSGSLVVKPHSPLRRLIIVLVIVLVLVGSGYVIYYYAQKKAGFNQLSAAGIEQKLQQNIAQLQREKSGLRDQVALLERTNQVDKQAYTEVSENLKALQEEILELREEVTFYRGIVAPLESSAGLRIERFKVEPSNEEGLFHYYLVLTQVLKNDRTARGETVMTIDGTQDGRPKTFDLQDVSTERNRKLNFRFRYFQKFEGDILLPKGFVPRSVLVTVMPHRQKNIKKSFNWPGSGTDSEENSGDESVTTNSDQT